MPAVSTRAWQFTHLSIPLWGDRPNKSLTEETLRALEQRLRRQLDDYAGVSLEFINDRSWAIFKFHSGINEDYRRRILRDIRECLPADVTLRWDGTCVETTVWIGGWVEDVGKMDPNRTRE